MGTFEDISGVLNRPKNASDHSHLQYIFLLVSCIIGYVNSTQASLLAPAVVSLLGLYFSIYKISVCMAREFLEMMRDNQLAPPVPELGEAIETETADEAVDDNETPPVAEEASTSQTENEEMTSEEDHEQAPTTQPEDEEMTSYEDSSEARVLRQLQQVVEETNERNRLRALQAGYTYIVPDVIDTNVVPTVRRLVDMSALFADDSAE